MSEIYKNPLFQWLGQDTLVKLRNVQLTAHTLNTPFRRNAMQGAGSDFSADPYFLHREKHSSMTWYRKLRHWKEHQMVRYYL